MSQNNSTAWVRLNSGAIKDWRLERRWSQERAAKMPPKMSEVTWRRCETGQLVQELTAAKVAKKTGLKLSELLVK